MNPRVEYFTKLLLENEGGYSNHPMDKGGKTIYGFTHKNFPAIFDHLYSLYRAGRIKEAELEARRYYAQIFYNPLYDKLPCGIAWKLFDLGVNMGVQRAVKLLQRTLRAMGKDIKVDGRFTEEVVRAVQECGDAMVIEYVKTVWRYYKLLDTFKFFGKGWKRRLLRIVKSTNYNTYITLHLPESVLE